MTLSVIASSSLSPGLRGVLTRWYLEVLPGIFIADVPARIRDEIWHEVAEWIWQTLDRPAYAALVVQAPTEQGFRLTTAGEDRYTVAGEDRYTVTDYDGISLVSRQHQTRPASGPGLKENEVGWVDF